jgi:transposase
MTIRCGNTSNNKHRAAQENVYGPRDFARRFMGVLETITSPGQAAPEQWAAAHCQPASPYGDSICVAHRDPVGGPSAGNGMRQRDDVLAAPQCLATKRRMGTNPRNPAGAAAQGRCHRLVARSGGLFFGTRGFWGQKTGPNPTDRRKAGTKHHVLSDANGIPLSFVVTGANTHDVTQLLPLVELVPPVRGKVGKPRQRPACVQGDRGYDSEPHRDRLRKKGITPILAKRYTEHGSGLGKTRWIIERTMAWLHQFRRLRVRYEKRADIHEAFVCIACIMICYNALKGFC